MRKRRAVTMPFFILRFRHLLPILSALIFNTGCPGWFLPDCESAVHYIALSHSLSREEQIQEVFDQVNVQVPARVSSVLDAKIELARLSFDEGCRLETDSATYLGILMLMRGDNIEEVIYYLEVGVEDRPTRHGLLALSKAYRAIGRVEEADLIEKDAPNHPEMAGSARLE